jgi:HEAT repeat protein
MKTIVTVIFLVAFLSAGVIGKGKETLDTNRAVENYLSGLKSENNGLKTSCAYFLGELGGSESVIPLMSVLRNDESEDTRIMAALSLYKIGSALSINAVKQAIRFDDSERVRGLCEVFYKSYLMNKEAKYVAMK